MEGSFQEVWAATGRGRQVTVTEPSPALPVSPSEESSRQLLVTVTMEGSLTLGLSSPE